jgi:hypothetical protein
LYWLFAFFLPPSARTALTITSRAAIFQKMTAAYKGAAAGDKLLVRATSLGG